MALRRISQYGLETEMLTIDSEGKLVEGGPAVIKAAKKSRIAKYVEKELSKAQVELLAKEKRSVKAVASAYLDNLHELVETAKKEGYHLLPLGTHPGRVVPKLERNDWYDSLRMVLEEDVFTEGRICGFHFHYTLPEGIVARDTQQIKTVRRSQAREIFLQQYNFLLAADPAILTFCQSSPFWMGYNWGKDCRVLLYRDMRVDRGPKSLHGMHYHIPIFGALPSYEFTLEDIRVMADTRKTEWLRLLEKKRFPTNKIAGIPALKFMWGPIRVNRIGTFEYRGPDMNRPQIVFMASRLLVYMLKAIEKMELSVLPSDIGADEPFILEDDTIYVPPHSTLKYLEKQSVVSGFDSQSVRKYCSSLFSLMEKVSKKRRVKRLTPLKKMIEDRKSVSDEILAMVKKNGYKLDEEVPEDMLNHVALYYADKLPEDIEAAKSYVQD